MKKNLSIATYRFIDLSIWTALIIIFEIISVKGLGWFNEVYIVSLFLTISLIVIRRWKAWAIIPILASSITYCYLNNGTLDNYFVYIVGNLFVLLAMIWCIAGKKIIKNTYVILIYILTGYFAVCIGRSIVASCFGYSFFSTLLAYIGLESLNALIAIIIIMIARKQDGLFEDQVDYIKRIKQEEIDAQNENNKFEDFSFNNQEEDGSNDETPQ